MALNSPAAERNKVPIGDILKLYFNKEVFLDTKYRVLEIASGYGTHAVYLSNRFKNVIWHPTEYDPGCLASIVAHLKNLQKDGLTRQNLESPVQLDVTRPTESWPTEINRFSSQFDFIFNANMVHITPWKCTEGLFVAASTMLKRGGKFIMYGPFAVDGILAPQSNIDFNNSLKLNDPEWGIRDVRDIEEVAAVESFVLHATHNMPSNNLILVWEKV